ncbi:glycosyltransferase [Flavobacterium cellulosilyticum]|uniref:Glycosyltransferase n=1 Tax=Flavobacterium cellulosilyticum TaxID=2541731 RepID=A0A4R5CFH0_9FLAO|nr:glycosyltransferase [Flavobacterium cellulosilyticum]TDD97033.1 glycosyltransferase [Flavobacterium cellulosilyticum]
MKIEKEIKMLIVSSYPPRECGLATFSNDVLISIKKVFGATLPIEICALQNEKVTYKYGKEVKYTIATSSLDNYRLVAEKINERNDIGLVCIQHEFGLHGGEYGNYILAFLLALNKQIITVFHTVLPQPDETRKKIVQAIIDLSNKIVVLTTNSREILVNQYGIQNSKINLIPHGIHSILWEQKKIVKDKYHYSDKIVLSAFGLISENKGIETVLYALPEIVAKHPEVIYLVIGKTHPEIIKSEGEQYRNQLVAITQELHLDNNVIFINEYVELKQLLDYLTLSDIYLFSSKDPNQAVSGTFAYAMGCGCAVISTPIPHAIEVLKEGNGILLNSFSNSNEFQEAIIKLVENKELRIQMGRKAFSQSQETIWENIAIKYGLLFCELTNKEEDLKFELPPLQLDHIKDLTTDYGILQFSIFSEPDLSSGYTLDDNARALINMIMHFSLYHDNEVLKLAEIYLRFIEGIQRKDGLFDNYKDIDCQLTAKNLEVNLEDSNGRALWSLGYVISHKNILPIDFIIRAETCWEKAFIRLNEINSPRAIAYTLKGLYFYHLVYPHDKIQVNIKQLADKLLELYNIHSEEFWSWYENYMTYVNNVLPEAMMYSYLATRETEYLKIATITFDFLLSHYFMKGQIKVISNRGWFKKENERVFYGEQPIEIATTIITLDLFYQITGNIKYKEQIKVAYNWYLGNNHLKQIMYNPKNGASYDGLEDKSININQGAESTLCFFKARMIMDKYANNNS